MSMRTSNKSMRPAIILFLCFINFTAFFLPSSAQSCQSITFSNSRSFKLCQSLSHLGSSLHWTYDAATGLINVAYRSPQIADGWVAWGLNPTGNMMIGTQAIIAFLGNGGGGGGTPVNVFTFPISDRNPVVTSTAISFAVTNLGAEFTNDIFTIFATILLPGNITTFNHVWQSSTLIANGVPAGHPISMDNIQSYGTIDFLTGVESSSGSNPVIHRRNIHGVISAISWGILIPIGAIIARYLRVFKSADPAWFYLHITCQCSAYILGVAGWGLGLKLGNESKGITHHRHRYIGIVIFILATLQVLALALRPRKDHKYRLYWNLYHHTVGYAVIILGVLNIFKGFNILMPANQWKQAYTAIITTLAGIALLLEVVTWIVVLRRRRRSSDEKPHRAATTNGANNGNV